MINRHSYVSVISKRYYTRKMKSIFYKNNNYIFVFPLAVTTVRKLKKVTEVIIIMGFLMSFAHLEKGIIDLKLDTFNIKSIPMCIKKLKLKRFAHIGFSNVLATSSEYVAEIY